MYGILETATVCFLLLQAFRTCVIIMFVKVLKKALQEMFIVRDSLVTNDSFTCSLFFLKSGSKSAED